jgi:hypothetical protein
MVDDVKMAQTRTGNAYLRVDLSEQSDSYDAAFFASFRPRSGELSIEEMRNLLEAAKTTRKPVVIVCKLALDGDNVRVNGRDVWDVDKFLAAIGRPVRITIDPTASLDAKLAEQMHRDAIHPGGGENRLRMLFQKRVATIKGWLEKSCGESEDGDSDGASVTITSDDDTITLPSLYKLDSTMFAVLQGMDGVIDVTEDPDDEEPSTDDELPEMAACF